MTNLKVCITMIEQGESGTVSLSGLDFKVGSSDGFIRMRCDPVLLHLSGTLMWVFPAMTSWMSSPWC